MAPSLCKALLLAAVASCALGAGCAGNVKKLEANTQTDIGDIRSLQASHAAQLEELQAEIRQLKGQVEELRFASLGKTQELEQRLERFGTRVPPPAGVPADLLAQDEELISKHRGVEADVFRRGLELVRGGDFESALRTYQEFVRASPGTIFTDNALFWTGVCFDKLGQYDRAIVAYSEVFQRYPAEDRVAAALFRLAGSFEKIGSKNEAKLSLQKLIDEHPDSTYAGKSKKKLKELKSRRR